MSGAILQNLMTYTVAFSLFLRLSSVLPKLGVWTPPPRFTQVIDKEKGTSLFN